MKNTDFENKIEYRFKDKKLLTTALTHSSYTKDAGIARKNNNERLEFLGDAFFDAIVGEMLYRRFPGLEEGRLTKDRSFIVCERALADAGRKLGIGQYLKLSRSEERMGGRDKTSIIADAMEAVIGAIFLDGGYGAARETVLNVFSEIIEDVASGKVHNDYKSALQELLQKKGMSNICYFTDRYEGPDHDKTFYVTVKIDGRFVGKGSGKSKRAAEQCAAHEALRNKEITDVF